MKSLKDFMNWMAMIFFASLILIFPSTIFAVSEARNWEQVAQTTTGIQYVDIGSASYDSKGFLSVFTKYQKLNEESQEIISTDIYEMGIDCEKRLYKDISINGVTQSTSTWQNPFEDKLIKKTIIKSCSF